MHTKYDTFIERARGRWKELVEDLPVDHQARMPKGHCEFSFEILDVDPIPTLRKLRELLKGADSTQLTGWGPFCYMSYASDQFEPYSANGQIETWLGSPDFLRILGGFDILGAINYATCDFWRADLDGFIFLRRGYQEDCDKRIELGTGFTCEKPICNIAEAMLYVARFSKLCGNDNPVIITRCFYSGLRGRELKNIGHPQTTHGLHVCHVDTTRLEIQATVEEIEGTLEEVVHRLLRPLYELFSRYELKMHKVEKVIRDLKQHRYE